MSSPNPKDTLKDVQLQEYAALGSAIQDATKRIETVRGLYLTAAFAIVGALISAEPGRLYTLIERLRSDRYLLTAVLLLPFLNSLLLVYMTSVMHFILAAAQYNTYELGPSITRQTKVPVLQFDIWSSENKEAWVFLRTLTGILYYGFATGASIGVLLCFRQAGRFHLGVLPGIAFVTSAVIVSLSIVVGGFSLLISKQFHAPKKARFPIRNVSWFTLVLSVLLYLVFVWII
jgi:hypothetical protein